MRFEVEIGNAYHEGRVKHRVTIRRPADFMVPAERQPHLGLQMELATAMSDDFSEALDEATHKALEILSND